MLRYSEASGFQPCPFCKAYWPDPPDSSLREYTTFRMTKLGRQFLAKASRWNLIRIHNYFLNRLIRLSLVMLISRVKRDKMFFMTSKKAIDGIAIARPTSVVNSAVAIPSANL